jgi:hypothetical protein
LSTMEKDELIKKLVEKRELVKKKLEERRLDMVDQDGPMQSIGITATRWMVEQDIEDLDKELARLEKGIKEVERLIKTENRFGEKYFVSDDFECTELGIISKKSSIGEKILAELTKTKT